MTKCRNEIQKRAPESRRLLKKARSEALKRGIRVPFLLARRITPTAFIIRHNYEGVGGVEIEANDAYHAKAKFIARYIADKQSSVGLDNIVKALIDDATAGKYGPGATIKVKES